MLSAKYNKPLKFDLKPSKILFTFIVLIHFLAVSVLFLSLEIPNVVLILLGLLIVINLYVSLRQSSSVKFKSTISQLHFLTEMQWQLTSSEQESTIAVLQEKWFSLPWIVILYFKLENKKNKSIIILPGMISNNNLRQLKLHLACLKS